MLYLMVRMIHLNIISLFLCSWQPYNNTIIILKFFLLHNFLGADGILLGAETLRGLYPIETIKVVGRICAEVSINTIKFSNYATIM